MNKRWGSKDNKIEKVVSTLLIPDICSYFVKCKLKKKKNVGKGHAFAEGMHLYIGKVTKQIDTFCIYQLKKGIEINSRSRQHAIS